MAYFHAIYNMGGGGSSPIIPTFSETKIGDNSAQNSSFTLTEDYHNYNLLRFKIENSDSSEVDYIYATPGVIDETFVITTVFLLNYQNTDHYVTYTISADNLTWSRANQRQMNCTEVVGLTPTNCTMTVTSLYAGTRTSPIAITDSIFDYDMLILGISRGNSYDEQGPTSDPVYLPNFVLPQSTLSFYGTNYTSGHYISISEHSISMASGGCYYVGGIKFS